MDQAKKDASSWNSLYWGGSKYIIQIQVTVSFISPSPCKSPKFLLPSILSTSAVSMVGVVGLHSYACMYAGIKPTSTRMQLFREIVQLTWTVHSKEVSLEEFQVLDLQNETWNNEKVLFLMILISFVNIFHSELWKSLLRKKIYILDFFWNCSRIVKNSPIS